MDARLAGRCDLIEVVPLAFGPSIPTWSLRQLRVALGLVMGRPRWVTNWSNEAFLRRVRVVARDWQPDIVQAEYHVMGQYLGAIQSSEIRRVLVQHEPGVRAALGHPKTASRMPGALAAVERRAWRKYEHRVMHSADAVVAFTEQDRSALHLLAPDVRIEVIPLGVAIPPVPATLENADPPRLLFVGNFVHPPNVDAALYLISEIFPSVQRAIPECRLAIVGEGAPMSILSRNTDKIIVTGRVPDVTPFMDEATLVLAPMRLGGGMRVKVLEALAAGKAVVATPRAVEGLRVIDGEELRIASTREDFVTAVITLIRTPGQRAALGARARAWAIRELDPSTMVRRYEKMYRSLSAAVDAPIRE